MEQPDQDKMPVLPELIGVALDRELLAPNNLLIMCGLTMEEIADELAEFDTEADSRLGLSQQEIVIEATAFRVAEVLDTITSQIHDQALGELGKKFILDVAFMTLTQVIVEQRAVIRHQNQELDHNCEQEQCPLGFIQFEPAEQGNDLNTNSGMSLASRLDTSAMWESEW